MGDPYHDFVNSNLSLDLIEQINERRFLSRQNTEFFSIISCPTTDGFCVRESLRFLAERRY